MLAYDVDRWSCTNKKCKCYLKKTGSVLLENESVFSDNCHETDSSAQLKRQNT